MRNLSATLTLPDKSRGQIRLNLRDGVVVGAMGSEPARFMGLTEPSARHLARYGAVRRVAKLALALSLVLGSASADAKPRKHARDTGYMTTCIHERTGPVGGVSVREARSICAAEQPRDELEYAKGQLTLAKLNARVAKAQARARKALESCEQAVTDRCVELADPVNGSDCNTEQGLRAEFVSVCFPVASEGK